MAVSYQEVTYKSAEMEAASLNIVLNSASEQLTKRNLLIQRCRCWTEASAV